ncbi:MAG: DUF4062 domain-containing protein [Actinobacteria bacterium]|nr:DUF4062 domain-containing protein [Actinomycetota bacterium]
MGIEVSAFRVLIASPGDVSHARDTIEDALHWWNQTHSWKRGVVFIPWRWETSAIPLLAGTAQSVIDRQGVQDADIVFALFASRLGSPTGTSLSGTAHEIERTAASGKPVHVYFSSQPLPHDIDTDQLEALRQFRKDLELRGLLGTYSDLDDLRLQVLQAIEHDLTVLQAPGTTPKLEEQRRGARFSVQPREEREINGMSNNGNPRYTTRHWVEVTNHGEEDAIDVQFSNPTENPSMLVLGDNPTVIHAGQMRKVTVLHTMGGGGPDIVRVSWSDSTGNHEKDFHV